MSGKPTSELMERLLQNLIKSEETGKIEASIYDDLSTLRDKFENLENFWLENGEDIENSFVMFHASKNCFNILQKMINRFENAHKEMENPAVALDAITILPSIFELKSILDHLKPEKFSKNISFNILDRIRNLRIHSRRLKMLPSEEEEIKKVSLRKSKNGFKIFSKNIIGMFFEEQSSS